MPLGSRIPLHQDSLLEEEEKKENFHFHPWDHRHHQRMEGERGQNPRRNQEKRERKGRQEEEQREQQEEEEVQQEEEEVQWEEVRRRVPSGKDREPPLTLRKRKLVKDRPHRRKRTKL